MADTLGAMFLRAGQRSSQRIPVKSAAGERIYADVLDTRQKSSACS